MHRKSTHEDHRKLLVGNLGLTSGKGPTPGGPEGPGAPGADGPAAPERCLAFRDLGFTPSFLSSCVARAGDVGVRGEARRSCLVREREAEQRGLRSRVEHSSTHILVVDGILSWRQLYLHPPAGQRRGPRLGSRVCRTAS